MRAAARRDETTTHPSSLESAARASRRRLTASSKAGGLSRNETPTSAKTYAGGVPASQSRSSSANLSGCTVSISSDRCFDAARRAIDPATMGQAARGNREMRSFEAGASSQRRRSGADWRVLSHNELTSTPRSPWRPPGCTSPSPAQAPRRARAPTRRPHPRPPCPAARPLPW